MLDRSRRRLDDRSAILRTRLGNPTLPFRDHPLGCANTRRKRLKRETMPFAIKGKRVPCHGTKFL